MKNVVRKFFAILMVLVMFFDAAPVAAVAEALQTEGQSALEETIRTPETPIITDAAEGQQFGVVLPEEPLVEESHTLTEGEYSVIPVEDPSGLLDLINSIPEMRDGAKSRQRVMKDAMIINNRRVVDYVAYDIELTENAAAAKEYNVTVPVGLDMLKDFRDSKQDFDISNISYQLYHIHTDENDETSVEEIGVSVTGENGETSPMELAVTDGSIYMLTTASGVQMGVMIAVKIVVMPMSRSTSPPMLKISGLE